MSWSPVISSLRANGGLPHQLINPIVAALLSQFVQVFMYLAITVHCAAFQPRLLDMPKQTPVFNTASGVRVGTPGVITTRMHGHHSAQPSY